MHTLKFILGFLQAKIAEMQTQLDAEALSQSSSIENSVENQGNAPTTTHVHLSREHLAILLDEINRLRYSAHFDAVHHETIFLFISLQQRTCAYISV